MSMRDLCLTIASLVLVLAGVPRLSAEETNLSAATTSVEARVDPTYQGKTYQQWVKEFRTELDPEQRVNSLKALVVFGTNGHADVVVPLILDVLDGYNVRSGLLLSSAVEEGTKKIDEQISAGRLPEGFSDLGFVDVADLRLFFAANRGLTRLASRATPVLVKYLEEPAALSAGRIMAMRSLVMEANEEWERLVPKLAARSDLTSTIALYYWNNDDLSAADSSKYEKCVKELLGLKSKGSLIRVVQTLRESKHHAHHAVVVPLLEELLKTSNDEEVRAAITQTLKEIPRPAELKSQVVPASAKEVK